MKRILQKGIIGLSAPPEVASQTREPHGSLTTFSIVAYCQQTGELGIAVSTAIPAVGAINPFAKARVGAIATQAWSNPYLGIDGLNLLEQGDLGILNERNGGHGAETVPILIDHLFLTRDIVRIVLVTRDT